MKYFVEFTEEPTKTYGYYVEAKNKDEAYIKAEDKYFNFKEADTTNIEYANTLGYKVEES